MLLSLTEQMASRTQLSLTEQMASRTQRKSSPPLEENAPGTFSQTMYLGYLPLLAHLV